MLGHLTDRVGEEALHHGQLAARVPDDDVVHRGVERLGEGLSSAVALSARCSVSRRRSRSSRTRRTCPARSSRSTTAVVAPDEMPRRWPSSPASTAVPRGRLDDGEQRGPVGRMHVVPHREGPPEPHGLDHVTLQQPEQLGPGVGRRAGRGVHGRALYRRPISLLAEVIGAPSNHDRSACMTRSGPTGATRAASRPGTTPPSYCGRMQLRFLVPGVAVALAAVTLARAAGWPPAALGAPGTRLRATVDRAAAAGSRQASDGRFHNTLPDEVVTQGSLLAMRAPCCARTGRAAPRPGAARRGPLPPAPAPLALTWYGHSSVLLEVDGRRVLADPVWGERVSPSPAIGPRRLHPVPVPLSALPPVDAVVISHDHYDHLDLPTVRALLHTQEAPFVVPLGLGNHLRRWGVPERGSSNWTGTSPTRSAA